MTRKNSQLFVFCIVFFFFLTLAVFCFLTQRTHMPDMDPETTHTEPAVDEEASLFSTMDLLLFSVIVGFVVYWFMSRKKPEPIPEFKKLDTP